MDVDSVLKRERSRVLEHFSESQNRIIVERLGVGRE